MRALRVLLTTVGVVVLLGYAVSAAAIEWILRDTTRPAPPRSAPTFAHRGLTCLSATSRQSPWWLRAISGNPDARAVARQNPFPAGTRTLTRVFIEWALARWLTRHYDREQLTRMHGDTAWFGRGAFGLEQGASAWFGRPLEQLSTDQAALLVGLEQQPNGLDPTRDAARALSRRQFILRAWEGCALIPEGTAAALEQTPVLEGVLPSRE